MELIKSFCKCDVSYRNYVTYVTKDYHPSSICLMTYARKKFFWMYFKHGIQKLPGVCVQTLENYQ